MIDREQLAEALRLRWRHVCDTEVIHGDLALAWHQLADAVFTLVQPEINSLCTQLALEKIRFACEADGHQCRFTAMERDLAALRQQLREQIETSEKERTELREQEIG